jgi:tRNA dimethylallyltransferase
VVGGTGFYLRALIDGLFEGPARSEELRARMRKAIQRKGPQVLHRALRRVDPDCAARISATDAERIIRSYEVYLVSGKTMTWWQQQPRDAFKGFRWLKIGIDTPRRRLYERINLRVDEMFQRGLLHEARNCWRNLPRYPRPSRPSDIGKRPLARGKMTTSEAVEERRSRAGYAKRHSPGFERIPR